MRGTLLFLAVAAFPLSAWASAPGQPLDCSDWVFLEPEMSCTAFPAVLPSTPGELSALGTSVREDNEGKLLKVRILTSNPGEYCGLGMYSTKRIEIVQYDEAQTSVVAYLQSRCAGNGQSDSVDWPGLPFVPITFDDKNGRLRFPVYSCAPPSCNTTVQWTAVIDGFTRAFDVFQTYTPQPAALNFRVPSMPEGMAGADHFDTYWGDLTPRVDFTQAHPLQCGFPAAQPHAGDYLTLPDPLPNPDSGRGRWYLTAAVYQGETRYGRKGTHGRLSGRDPAIFPACVQP